MQGKRIKQIREKLILSQEEFAKLLGVSRQTVSGWETNRYEINKGNEEKILKLITK